MTENGIQSNSSSCDSDPGSDHVFGSDENDREQHSDSCLNNTIYKKFIKRDDYIELNNSSGTITDQRKVFNPSDIKPNDKKTISILPSNSPANIIQFSTDKNFEQGEYKSNNRSPERYEKSISEVKHEISKDEMEQKGCGSQHQIVASITTMDEPRVENAYCFSDDIKELKENPDEFKVEVEDTCNKSMDKNDMFITNNNKRTTDENNSPYKEKKRKLFSDNAEGHQDSSEQRTVQVDIIPPSLQKPVVTKVFYSYFEQGSEDKDEIREIR